MSGPSRPAGRPAGADPDTLAKGRLYLALIGYGHTPSEIAAREGVQRSEVYRVMNLVRPPAAVDAEPDGTAEIHPAPQPRRMSRRTLTFRAWEYAERNAVVSLSLAACDFWVRIVVAIHENGDGVRLRLGEPGRRFQTRADLAMLRMAQVSPQDVDVDGWLAALVERGRLIDLGGRDIAIPLGLGLTPGENALGKPVSTRAPRQPANTPQPSLPLLREVKGGLSVSKETPISLDTDPPISLDTAPQFL